MEEVLRTGIGLADILAGLIEDLDESERPQGENSAEMVVGMVTGSFLPAAEAAGERTVRDATALIAALFDRVHDDLKAALEIRREMEAP